MLITPEALTVRLAEAGIRRVAVIDDAFDEQKLVGYALGVAEFWAEIAEHEDWPEQLASNAIPYQDVHALETDGLVELWRKRSLFNGTLLEAVKVVFADAEEKLVYPTRLAENLRRLNLTVECFDLPTVPKNDGPPDARLEDVQLVFLDYDLEGEDRVDLGTRELRSHAIAKFLARRRGDSPFLVLFSSLPGVNAEAERFRQQAFYLRGAFLFIPKDTAARCEELCQALAPSCVWSRDIGHFQHFFVTLRERLTEVAADVERSLLQLDVQDYAHFQHVALQEDGAPLGEYMLDLFGAVLSHEFRAGRKVQEARVALDRIDLTRQHLPFQSQPTAPLERIYRAVLTEPGIGPIAPHPHMSRCAVLHRDKNRAVPPLLMLGDIFAKDAKLPVYVVMNPACDLQYCKGRAPKLEHSVFLLAGTLESLAVPTSRPTQSERMRWLQYQGTDYRVLWNTGSVEAVPLVAFNRWKAKRGYERIARLSLPYSLALQQSWLANLGRVGLPVSPPLHDAHDMAVFLPDMTKHEWIPVGDLLKQEAIVAAHPADSHEPVKFCLTVTARDYLFNEVTKAAGLLTAPRKVAAEAAIADPHLWWKLVSGYEPLVNKNGRWCWKFTPKKGTSRPVILCLWKLDPQPEDLNELNHAAIAFVLRPSGHSSPEQA